MVVRYNDEILAEFIELDYAMDTPDVDGELSPEMDAISDGREDAQERFIPVHTVRQRVSLYERACKNFYRDVAHYLGNESYDISEKDRAQAFILSVCINKGASWPLIGDEGDHDIRDQASQLTFDDLKSVKFDICDRIFDEIQVAACAVETLRYLDTLGREVPERLGNLPKPLLCRKIAAFAYEQFGGWVPGWGTRAEHRRNDEAR